MSGAAGWGAPDGREGGRGGEGEGAGEIGKRHALTPSSTAIPCNTLATEYRWVSGIDRIEQLQHHVTWNLGP